MLAGLLNIIFTVLIFLVNLLSWAMLAYVIMQLVIPQNKYTLLLARYAEPVLVPVRALLARLIPKLGQWSIDISPLVVWLGLDIVAFLLRLLRNILL